MNSAIELIIENADRYPEFRYYLPLIKKAERNIENQPDICIEICKSLFEGVSKSILERISPEITRAELDKMEVGPLVKKAVRGLRQFDNVIENDFVTRSTSLAYAFGMLRNARGDISHGKGVPKEKSSNERLAVLAMQMSEGLLSYMLDAFFSLDIKRLDWDGELVEEGELAEVAYDDNQDFNDYLDEQFPLEGKPLYSLALYQQYYEDYLIQLDEYREEMETAEE